MSQGSIFRTETSTMTGSQRLSVILCILLAITDGLDAQLLAYAAPHVVKEFGFGPASFGVVFSASLVGMAIGSVAFGMLADRLGRSRMMLGATVLFALATLAIPWVATDIPSFLMTRFLAGLGLGGVTPVVIALIAQNTPPRIRSLAVMVAVGSLSLGAFVSGIVASWLIPAHGWRSTFYVGGTVPLVIAFLLYFALRALGPVVARPDEAPVLGDGVRPGSVRGLFQGGRALSTLTLWAVFFANLLVLFAMLNWLPTLFLSLGLSPRAATLAGAVFSLGGFTGGVVMGILLGRTERRHLVVVTGFGVGIVGIFGVVVAPGELPILLVAVALAGAGVVGGLTGVSALAVLLYPEHVRAAGVGWAYGVGRIGSIVGPILSGALVAGGLGATSIIGLAAVPAALAAGGVVALGAIDGQRRAVGNRRPSPAVVGAPPG
jgi:AAHS family 4-hydroxybenzoate transporter-like MFS transporter